MAYNSRYQYETSPRKLRPEYDVSKKTYPKKSTARKTKQESKSNIKKKQKTKNKPVSQIKILSYIAIGFVTLFGISYRYAVIDKTHSDIQGLKSELAVIEKETAQLEANMESNLRLTTIEQEAREKLGMKKLSSEQIVYVTLPKTDFVESGFEEIEDTNANPNWIMVIIDKIMETLK